MTPLTVFISHAHADIDVTDQYAEQLKLHGIHVWYDRSDMPDAGSLFAEINQELKSCANFIVLFTEKSESSFWVNREINAYLSLAAEDPSRLILPVKVRKCDMPPLLAGGIWIDATAMSFEEAIDRIVRALHRDEPEKADRLAPAFTRPIRSVTREPVPDVVAAFPVTIAVIALLALMAIVLVVYSLALGGQAGSPVINFGRLSFGTALEVFAVGVLLGWLYGMLHFAVSRALRWISAVLSRVPPTEYTCSMDIRIGATAKGENVRRLTEKGIAIQRDTLPSSVPLRNVNMLSSREERLARNESLDRCSVRAIMRLPRSNLSFQGVSARVLQAGVNILKLQRSSLPFKGVFIRAVYVLVEYSFKVAQSGLETEPVYTMVYASATLKSVEELDDKAVATAQDIVKKYLMNPYLEQPLSLD